MSGDVSIYDLKCVIAVAQEGSQSRAAARMRTNQSVISNRIHHVEAVVEVKLLYTWRGGMRLTEAEKYSSRRFFTPPIGMIAGCSGHGMR